MKVDASRGTAKPLGDGRYELPLSGDLQPGDRIVVTAVEQASSALSTPSAPAELVIVIEP